MSTCSDELGAYTDAQPRRAPKIEVQVTPRLSEYPRSHVANYRRPSPVVPEHVVLKSLKSEWRKFPDQATSSKDSASKRKVIIADLRDFEVYRCPRSDRVRPSELTSLHFFDVKAKSLCFDGQIRLGNVVHHVERVAIDDISIEGYGRTNNSRVTVYVRSQMASKDATHEIWLRLRKPAAPYERFHTPFLWVALFSKLTIDYMDEQPMASVSLESFRAHFHQWLRRSVHDTEFKAWFVAFRKKTDFRVAFNAYANFIYNQAVNLSTANHLTTHPVWSHCMVRRMTAIDRQPSVIKDVLATPHVMRCFKNMYFASKMKQASPVDSVAKKQRERMRLLGFAEEGEPRAVPEMSQHMREGVRVGDVVSIIPDGTDKAKWKASRDEWPAYVQAIEGERVFVLWLYWPSDTMIGKAHYPFANEVFMSDHCNCDDRRFFTTDIARKYRVDWNPKVLNPAQDLIIRTTYVTNDSSFITLNDRHKACQCRTPLPKHKKWVLGDQVYIEKTAKGRKYLEPILVEQVDYDRNEVTVRILLRLEKLQSDRPELLAETARTNIARNELVLTDRFTTVSLSRIKRAGHVKFVSQEDVLRNNIPALYNKGGAGDYWFISMRLVSHGHADRLVSALPESVRQAQEKPLPCKPLRGLSFFGGGGNLDRGLEEAGAVEFETSVDYDLAAINTQRANCRNPETMRLRCESVDDYIHNSLTDKGSAYVTGVGEVDLIVAGTPCPGFSSLQPDILSDQSLTNAAHLTTFPTGLELHRPLFAILENVVNMSSERKQLKDNNPLSQLVACVVSLGYQANQFILDSWNYGSCQQRSRLILTVAAPGLSPINPPAHTHSLPYKETLGRSLGVLPNGQGFGDREFYPTPFTIVSAQEAMRDLPDIGSGGVQTCIPFPDHRLSRTTSAKDRALLQYVPKQPPGCGYKHALQAGLVPPQLQVKKERPGKAYTRIKAARLVPTITTAVNLQDAQNGASVHWSHDRSLGILEARRTQGYLDDEPIIGSLAEQWRILGNGVDRKGAFAVGLELRNAILRSEQILGRRQILENDVELMVDAEDTQEVYLSQATGQLNVSSAPSTSSSVDSFSSTYETRRRSNMSLSLDGACDAVPSPEALPSITPQRVEAESKSAPTESLLSRLSQTVSTNVARLTLPTIPTFLPSTMPYFATKRRREDNESGELEVAADRPVESLKRAKVVELRCTMSPIPTVSRRDIKHSQA